MPNPAADCGGEEHAGRVRHDGNAGCNGCAVNECVGVRVRCRLGAGGTVCVEGGGSDGDGGKVEGFVGLGSIGNGDYEVEPVLHVLPVLCGAGWLDGACGILGWGDRVEAKEGDSGMRVFLACCQRATQGWKLMLS